MHQLVNALAIIILYFHVYTTLFVRVSPQSMLNNYIDILCISTLQPFWKAGEGSFPNRERKRKLLKVDKKSPFVVRASGTYMKNKNPLYKNTSFL